MLRLALLGKCLACLRQADSWHCHLDHADRCAWRVAQNFRIQGILCADKQVTALGAAQHHGAGERIQLDGFKNLAAFANAQYRCVCLRILRLGNPNRALALQGPFVPPTAPGYPFLG